MKICRLLYTVWLLQFINSCLADDVSKTEPPATTGGGSKEGLPYNNTDSHQKDPDATTSNTATIENIPTKSFKDTSADISESVGQASQIQSSFEDIPKPKSPADDIVVKDTMPGVLNQGTLSQDPSDTIMHAAMSLVDTASADLHQRASSASADPMMDEPFIANTTADSSPPIVILPSGEEVQRRDAVSKGDSTSEQTVPDPLQPPIVRAEPKILEQSSSTTEDKSSQASDSSTGKSQSTVEQPTSQDAVKPLEPVVPSPQSGATLDLVNVPAPEIPQEEIPSFSEWTQKQLEEAEKKKGQNKTAGSASSRGPTPSKVRSKNYASPDCGAKIVAANPEAENPNGVLASSKDEYLINKCSTQRMWLIIELCEAVQAKKIELANFELFSSSPKEFSVYLSHNFPSRDWSSVGQFTAKDERTVQSFNLHPHLFGKFLKVEFNSHYGKEHFCCTSLIRIYGTSEFEVLETENEGHGTSHDLDEDDEDELPIRADTGKPAKNLFGHATDAVYTIVRKAAEVLVKSGDRQNKSQVIEPKNTTALVPSYRVQPQHCSTLRHLVVCNNCSEEFFDQVYHLLSCQSADLQSLIESPFVFDGINNSQLCSFYGLDFISKRHSASPLRLKHEDQLDQAGYLAAMLPAEYISALCNILAVLEGKVVMNTSQAASAQHFDSGGKSSQEKRDSDLKNLLIEHQAPKTCSVEASITLPPCQQSEGSSSSKTPDVLTSYSGDHPGASPPSFASEIKPTKTLTVEEVKDISAEEGTVPQVPVLKSRTPPEVVVTADIPSKVKHEPSVGFGSSHIPSGSASDKVKFSSEVPEIGQEAVTQDHPALEAPPAEKERDLADAAFGLYPGTDDQEPAKDLDALFMEMKALDNNEETSTESSPTLGGSATHPSTVTQPRAPSQQGQKESVFLRLSNKIKALERNMSLSGQYLEELSRRYKKQEELSRALNKTLVVLREEIRKSKDREQQRESDIHFLRTQLIQITDLLESYQSEQDSWQHKAVVISQHFILIVIEVVMFGVVVWMCRRFPSDSGTGSFVGPHRKSSKVPKSHVKHLKRRSSLDGLRSSSDSKKRRPSEEALQITGSYKDLLLEDENVIIVQGEDVVPHSNDTHSWLSVSSSRDQKRKRKRRKEGLIKSNSSNNLSQLHVKDNQSVTRKISAPIQRCPIASQAYTYANVSELNPCSGSSAPSNDHGSNDPDVCVSESALVPDENESPAFSAGQVSAPFMETASSLRSRRSIILAQAELPFHYVHSQDWKSPEGDSGSSVSGQSSRSKGLDSLEPVSNSNQSDCQAGIPIDKKKKNNKKGGLKSMVKKFF